VREFDGVGEDVVEDGVDKRAGFGDDDDVGDVDLGADVFGCELGFEEEQRLLDGFGEGDVLEVETLFFGTAHFTDHLGELEPVFHGSAHHGSIF